MIGKLLENISNYFIQRELNKLSITDLLLNLPEFVTFEGIEFELKIFKNASDELRICYDILSIYPTSPHYDYYIVNRVFYNRFTETYTSFLVLMENISDDNRFKIEILSLSEFLHKAIKEKLIEV